MSDRETAQALHENIIRMKKIIKINIENSEAIKSSEEQFRTLAILKDEKAIYLKDLSARTGVSTSSLCIMFSKLVEEGIVGRKIDKKDRRNTIYSLTEEGHRFFQEEREKRLHVLEQIIMKLSDAKKEELCSSLLKTNQILDELLIRLYNE